jgi:hydrogenase large subunit
MVSTVVIDPVTRIEGHLKLTISVDVVGGVQQIVDAWASGTLFRGFERILLTRHPWDAPHICERICGVCPVSQGTAAVLAVEQATQKASKDVGTYLLRALIGAANFIDSHILSFYHLSLPDFVNGPAMAPWQPAWTSAKVVGNASTEGLVQNYIKALDFRRKAQEMSAIFGGRMPHPPGILPGGITTTVRPERVAKFQSLLSEVAAFVLEVYSADVQTLATLYPEYYDIGRGHGHLLAYGAFGTGTDGLTDPALRRGHVQAGQAVVAVNTRAIAEQVTYSWYDEGPDGALNNLKPHEGVTTAKHPKEGAYSWLKAPRYNGYPCEVGPLARQTINGSYARGISVMDRHIARAQEAAQLIDRMSSWLGQLQGGSPSWLGEVPAVAAKGEGLTEAPRGALGHWIAIGKDGRIAQYQVVTPTCWNASPRDTSGVRGPIEEALIGTPILDIAQPVEALRVLHSFDPCTACAVHVMRPERAGAMKILHVA